MSCRRCFEASTEFLFTKRIQGGRCLAAVRGPWKTQAAQPLPAAQVRGAGRESGKVAMESEDTGGKRGRKISEFVEPEEKRSSHKKTFSATSALIQSFKDLQEYQYTINQK